MANPQFNPWPLTTKALGPQSKSSSVELTTKFGPRRPGPINPSGNVQDAVTVAINPLTGMPDLSDVASPTHDKVGWMNSISSWLSEKASALIESIQNLMRSATSFFTNLYRDNPEAIKYSTIAVLGAAGIYAAYKIYQKMKEKSTTNTSDVAAMGEAFDATRLFFDRICESTDVLDQPEMTEDGLYEYIRGSVKLAEKMSSDPTFKNKENLDKNLQNVYAIRLVRSDVV